MKKKLQVFISSTSVDLQEERQAAIEAILDTGHIPAGMEMFKGGRSIMETIYHWIDQSDVYVLVLGGKYGSVEEGKSKSYTELEYDYAVSKGMPIFEIFLTETFLYQKAAVQGGEIIFEQDHKEEYRQFKKSVEDKREVQYANNLDDLKRKIQININTIVNDSEFHLLGWLRADQSVENLEYFSGERLVSLTTDIYHEIIKRRYKMDVLDFPQVISEDIFQAINFEGLYSSVKRMIRIVLRDDGLADVHIMNNYDYMFLSETNRKFGMCFDATKQQAETFRLNKLLINQEEHTQEFKHTIAHHPERGQLTYVVDTEKGVEIPEESCNIYTECSYTCSPLEFFQSYRLPYPCRDFSMTACIENDREHKYNLVAATFSPFSKVHYDDFKASELKNYGVCQLRLPKWSVSGAGYALTMRKTK